MVVERDCLCERQCMYADKKPQSSLLTICRAVLCCAVLCCAVLCCAVLCCAVLCCAAFMQLCCCCQVLPKVKQQLESAHRDVAAVAADLHRGVQRNMRDMQVRDSAEAESAVKCVYNILNTFKEACCGGKAPKCCLDTLLGSVRCCMLASTAFCCAMLCAGLPSKAPCCCNVCAMLCCAGPKQ
jgi:hypothetical protein